MRDPKLQKITASVTLEVGQLERLNEAADRARVSRSVIVRDAIERELKRYEKPDEIGEPLQKGNEPVWRKTATRP
jgi:metal-responsive CopG/Arc/MetJ family transcriptional regulator